MENLALSADLGGTNLRIAVVRDDGEIIHREKTDTPDGGVEPVAQAIVKLSERCIDRAGGKESFAGFGVAVPAVLDTAAGVIVESPNLPVLNGWKIVDALSSKVKLPVTLENDATSAAIGESWLGASKGTSHSVCLTLGTGVGGGLIVDGRPVRGADGTAGELGHVCIEPFGHPCGCGSVGCLEQYASATAVVRMAKERRSDFPESDIEISDTLSSVDIFNKGMDGDELAVEVFRRMGFCLGVAIAGFINMLNPEVVVIGGGAAAGWPLFAGEMLDTIKLRAFSRPANRARIVRASLGDDAGLLGAASLVFSRRRPSS